jgi:hypothetical protein
MELGHRLLQGSKLPLESVYIVRGSHIELLGLWLVEFKLLLALRQNSQLSDHLSHIGRYKRISFRFSL